MSNQETISKFVDQMLLSGKANSSIGTYTSYVGQLAKWIDCDLSQVTDEMIRSYFLNLRTSVPEAEQYYNSAISAIKLFTEIILKRKWNDELHYIKVKHHKLKEVLTISEVQYLLETTYNLKHRCILGLLYSSMLRVNELVNLKCKGDIDSKQMIVNVRVAKGGKERITILSEKVLGWLREYYMEYKPQEWLFEGQKPGAHLTVRTVEHIMEQGLERCNIDKQVSPHGLRRTGASHLLEAGTDLRTIQILLGHNDISTTTIYTQVSTSHISKIKSLLDK
ncbi:tyrosine-type recombinase/integrase [Candidatus Dependentiae bacterium]|nr:tyrosine-type recombinase/integrase [Candidatus Dependentiae bacterium]